MNYFSYGLYGVFAAEILLKIYKYKVLKVPFRYFTPIRHMDEREILIRLKTSRITAGFYDGVLCCAMLASMVIFDNLNAVQLLLLVLFTRGLIHQAADLYFRGEE